MHGSVSGRRRHNKTVHVCIQSRQPSSILVTVSRLISLRPREIGKSTCTWRTTRPSRKGRHTTRQNKTSAAAHSENSFLPQDPRTWAISLHFLTTPFRLRRGLRASFKRVRRRRVTSRSTREPAASATLKMSACEQNIQTNQEKRTYFAGFIDSPRCVSSHPNPLPQERTLQAISTRGISSTKIHETSTNGESSIEENHFDPALFKLLPQQRPSPSRNEH